MTGDFLGPPARALAAQLGYSGLPSAAPREAGDVYAPARLQRQRADETQQILARFDELSDQEVELLLSQHLVTSESDR
jgi:hypothetical protein